MTSVMHIDINSSSNSYPPTKPFDNLTITITPIISITINAEAILVKMPNKIAKPPIASKSAMGMNNSEGIPTGRKKLFPPVIS